MNRRAPAPIAPVALLLCTIVRQSPGIHFRGLARAAKVSSTGQLRHHIDRLGRRGALIEVEDGRFKRFFLPGDQDPEVRLRLARFARPVPLLIGRILLDRPLGRTALRQRLGCADSTLGYHLNRMVRLGDVRREAVRNSCLYSLVDPPFVRELLARHDASVRYGVAPASGPDGPPPGPQPANPFHPVAPDPFVPPGDSMTA